MRAVETSKPPDQRVCNDPVAAFMVGQKSVLMARLLILSGIYGLAVPGGFDYIIGRERYIDDFLKSALTQGLEQVVILGAGFDSRAYRIEGIDKTKVFEVDHPATQKIKLQRLNQFISPLPSNITFVAVDFNTQTLKERLFASGYDERKKTLFIWQGVTMYLTTTGVDSTLAFIANHSGEGSTVIFDYFYSQSLGKGAPTGARNVIRIARALGENIEFGIEKGKLAEFLSARGFAQLRDINSTDLKDLYFTGANAGRKPGDGLAIGSAVVKREKISTGE